jgi:hypothetical protein
MFVLIMTYSRKGSSTQDPEPEPISMEAKLLQRRAEIVAQPLATAHRLGAEPVAILVDLSLLATKLDRILSTIYNIATSVTWRCHHKFFLNFMDGTFLESAILHRLVFET